MIFVVGATEARFARPVSEVIRLPSNALLSWLVSYHRQRRGADVHRDPLKGWHCSGIMSQIDVLTPSDHSVRADQR